MKNIPTYDCHNKTHFQVKDEFENWLLLNVPPLNVVTGNSGGMRKIILDILNEHNFNYFIPYHNQGMIKVL